MVSLSHLYASAMEMGMSPKTYEPGSSSSATLPSRRAQWQGPPVSTEWQAEAIDNKTYDEHMRLEEKLTAEASSMYFDQNFDAAAFLWSRSLFIVRKWKMGLEKEAAICSNIGAACHSLGEWDEACEHYSSAKALFEGLDGTRNRLDRWLDSGAALRTQRKIDYILNRMEQCANEERPTQGEWLDVRARRLELYICPSKLSVCECALTDPLISMVASSLLRLSSAMVSFTAAPRRISRSTMGGRLKNRSATQLP